MNKGGKEGGERPPEHPADLYLERRKSHLKWFWRWGALTIAGMICFPVLQGVVIAVGSIATSVSAGTWTAAGVISASIDYTTMATGGLLMVINRTRRVFDRGRFGKPKIEQKA